MDLAEAAKILDPWIQEAKDCRYQNKPWPVGSLSGEFNRIQIWWYVNEQEILGSTPSHRWPKITGRVKPQFLNALAVWSLYHGGPGMLEE